MTTTNEETNAIVDKANAYVADKMGGWRGSGLRKDVELLGFLEAALFNAFIAGATVGMDAANDIYQHRNSSIDLETPVK